METVFRHILNEFTGLDLSEHEVITLVRKFRIIGLDNNSDKNRDKIQSLLQAELRRDNFSFFDKVLLALDQFQIKKDLPLSKSEIRLVFLSSLGISRSQHRIQAIRQLLDAYLKTFTDDTMDYKQLVHDLDWIKNPCRPICPAVIRADCDQSSDKVPSNKDPVKIINYRKMMTELENIA